MAMGGVFWKGGSEEVARPIVIAQFKMEGAYILCTIIEIIWQRKVTKTERGRPSSPSRLQITLAHLCKNTLVFLCKHPNTSIAKRGIDWWGVDHVTYFFWLEPH
jgi:hypothetical protein